MGARKDGALADGGTRKKLVAKDGRVVFEADVNGETFRQQNVGGHAVDVPRIPALREMALHGPIFGGRCGSGLRGGRGDFVRRGLRAVGDTTAEKKQQE